MSQRKEEKKDPKSDPRLFAPLRRTKSIKYDLDKQLLMLNIIETTHKSELKKMVKK